MEKKLVDPNKLCMGCMSQVEDTEVPCPKCGFLSSCYVVPGNSMPPYEIINGKYLIGRVIGIGGFGITYIAWDFYQSKRVCIKEYFPRGIAARDVSANTMSFSAQYSMNVMTTNSMKAKYMYDDGLHSYIKEAENLSKFFLMPGIVSVRDFFYGNQTAYIVMEYIEGQDMKQLAKRNGGRLEPNVVFAMLQDVLKALNAVHKTGIIHRDISPDNIMVNRNFQAKIIDFGAAKQYGGLVEGALFLKHGYAPIEQYDRNGNMGPWTDVYSMCATIYYLLTGIKIPKVHNRIAQETVVPLRKLGIAVSEMQEKAIQKGLNIQPQDRYLSMADLYHGIYGECLPGEIPPGDSQGVQPQVVEPLLPSAQAEVIPSTESTVTHSEISVGYVASKRSSGMSQNEVAMAYLREQIRKNNT